MKVNFGFFVSKALRWVNRPALRKCEIDKTAKVGTGSNCIAVKMGRYSYMGKNNSICNAEIGAFCSIASYCAIGGGTHSLVAVSTSPVFQGGRNILGKNFAELNGVISKPVKIGNDVWIGENVFINDNIIIGDGAVIGAHSVVTHDVPPYAIVVGAPAKVVRYRFKEEEIDELLQIRWWEWPEDRILQMGYCFDSIEHFLQENKKHENFACG